jgi:hypothetical protein
MGYKDMNFFIYRIEAKGGRMEDVLKRVAGVLRWVKASWLARNNPSGFISSDFSPPREHGNRPFLRSKLRRVLRLTQSLIPQVASDGEKSGLGLSGFAFSPHC